MPPQLNAITADDNVKLLLDLQKSFDSETGTDVWAELLELVAALTSSHIHVFSTVVQQLDKGENTVGIMEVYHKMRALPQDGDMLVVVFNTTDSKLIRDGHRVDRTQLKAHTWAVVFIAGDKADGGRNCAEVRIYDPNKASPKLHNEGGPFWNRVGHHKWLHRFLTPRYTKWFRFAHPDMQNDESGLSNILTAKFIAEGAQLNFDVSDDRWVKIPSTPDAEDQKRHTQEAKQRKSKGMRGWKK
ncbi:hypothetical protein C8F04DRAFT_1079995 [Mycena alexandri]|uniref:Uncharacterized protein n=1 Tax=Mycena alexandri TaxID=1745969 RepID=A0AAD6TAD1_9AGAR|nr:hypothetical protein C8F04DRAFT_1079995 [Mycena alexandri]